MMFVWLKKSFDQAINKHIIQKRIIHFVKQTCFQDCKKTKYMLQKEVTFQRKFILNILYLNSTNINFVSLMEGAISINALMLWNEHIS